MADRSQIPRLTTYSILTPVGGGALQIFEVRDPDESFRSGLLRRFEPRGGPSSLQLGILHDEHGEPLDEVMIEEGKGRLLIHAHQGSAVQQALLSFLGFLGAKTADPVVPMTLQQELEWALETASTEMALDVALANLRLMPAVSGATTELLESYPAGCSLFNPEPILLFGAPNAGKSSLLNALAGRERSIVSETAGTTRDLVEASILVGGRRVLLRDSAGVREAGSKVESLGVNLTVGEGGSGRVLWVVNPHQSPGPRPVGAWALVLTHQDLGSGAPVSFEGPVLRVRHGDSALEVRNFLEKTLPPLTGGPVVFTLRQRDVLEKALASGRWSRALWEGA